MTMRPHVLPTLPEPAPTAHDHEMPHDVPGRDDETGQAAFVVACLLLAVTLAMGILAIGQLKGGSLASAGFDRATAAHMEPPGSPGTQRATLVSGPAAFR